MQRDANGPALSAIFVDYDNIYLSLKRKNDEAAKRFSKDAALWLREIESGRLITTTSGFSPAGQRRIVLNRCYGNPVPRRNSNDNSTDMNSFPFVRHHFLRSGSEVIDCPPLTAQLKNSADIRIVMDVRDMLTHDTYFDEFIILSGDADFTPLLHRLRAHARRTVIYTNDHTASPYTAISDGEVRESQLLQLLMDGRLTDATPAIEGEDQPAQITRAPAADLTALRHEIAAEVATLVRDAHQPVPLEALADRVLRQLGHDKTAGSGWGGTGGFRELLTSYLPSDLRLSEQAPFVVFEVARAINQPPRLDRQAPAQQRAALSALQPAPAPAQHIEAPAPIQAAPVQAAPAAQFAPPPFAQLDARPASIPAQHLQRPAIEPPQPAVQVQATPSPAQRVQTNTTSAIAIQQAVARIYEACQAPPLSPPEYRVVFDVMANEITTRGLTGAPTLDNIVAGAKSHGVDVRRDDVRFVLEVVSEVDPWFEQGASANLFSSRFRNFVIARCRSHGLSLSADELDLIEHWFAGAASAAQPQAAPVQQAPAAQPSAPVQQPQRAAIPAARPAADNWWSIDQQGGGGELNAATTNDEFPRIIRSRVR
jgi:NYN domain